MAVHIRRITFGVQLLPQKSVKAQWALQYFHLTKNKKRDMSSLTRKLSHIEIDLTYFILCK